MCGAVISGCRSRWVRAGRLPRVGAAAGGRGRGPRALAHGGGLSARRLRCAMHGLDLDFTRRLDRTAWRILTVRPREGSERAADVERGTPVRCGREPTRSSRPVEFEAQAAMELEACATGGPAASTRRRPRGAWQFVVRTRTCPGGGRGSAWRRGLRPDRRAFPRVAGRVITDACARIRRGTDLGRVALSGGVFQNSHLLQATVARLEHAGFEVFTHRQVPPTTEAWRWGKPRSPRRARARAPPDVSGDPGQGRRGV